MYRGLILSVCPSSSHILTLKPCEDFQGSSKGSGGQCDLNSCVCYLHRSCFCIAC